MGKAIQEIAFFVAGTPVSQQSKGTKRREEWAAKLRQGFESATRGLEGPPWEAVRLTIVYKCAHPTRSPDLDNVLKPTVDALKRYAYSDDKSIQQLLIERVRHNQYPTLIDDAALEVYTRAKLADEGMFIVVRSIEETPRM